MTSDPAGGDVWRVLTWNVRGHDRPNVAALAEVVEGYAPDVVALQEIRTGQASELAGRLGWRHRWALKHYAFTPLMPWLAEGHALITPHALDDTVVRTISPGVSTWTYRRRIVLAGTVRRGGAAVRIYDTHLAAHDHPDERIAQAKRVAGFIVTDGARSRVVAGDLNADGEIEVIRELRAAGLDDPGGGPTHPASVPSRRFDYILVPNGSTVVEQHQPDGGAEWLELSDHLPVLLGFTLPA